MNLVFWSKEDSDLVQDGTNWVSQTQYASLHSTDGFSMTTDEDSENCLVQTDAPTADTLMMKDSLGNEYESQGEQFVAFPGHNPFRPKVTE